MNQTCPAEEKLALWLEGALENGERATVSDHLASCDDCRRTVAMGRVMKDEPVHALTDAQQQAALGAVRPGIRRPTWPWMAAAAAVLVAILIPLWALPRSSDSTPAPLAVNGDEGPKRMIVPANPPSPDPVRTIAFAADFGRAQDPLPFQLLAGSVIEQDTLKFATAMPGLPPATWNRTEPMRWLGVETPEAIAYAPEDRVSLRLRTTASHVLVWIEGHLIDLVPAHTRGTWGEAEVRIGDARLNGAPMTAAAAVIRNLYLAVPGDARLDVEVLRLVKFAAGK